MTFSDAAPPSVGERLSRQECFAAYGPQAVIHAWESLVMPRALTVAHVEKAPLRDESPVTEQLADGHTSLNLPTATC